MATTVRTFDTLGYAKFLANKGVEAKVTAAENRLVKIFGKMLAIAVGAILAGIPIMQALLQKLG